MEQVKKKPEGASSSSGLVLEELNPPKAFDVSTLETKKKLRYRHCNRCGGNELRGNFTGGCVRDGDYEWRETEI